MVNANELRVGNRINYKNSITGKATVVRIDALKKAILTGEELAVNL